jgi:glycosyltransferase involved in cell wall biosynthesis
VLQLLESLAMRASTHVVFNSRSLRRLTESEGLIAAGRGIVIASGSGNGVDVSRFIDLSDGSDVRSRLGIPADAGVVGFVGRLARGKGVDDLLRAFDVVGDSFHDVRLVVIGEVDKVDPVDSTTVDRLSNDPSVTWVGWREDLQSLYPVFDVLAFPSYREGLPNVVLEAQAAGVPVVAYAATGTTDAVLDGVTGVLVDVGSVRALSGAIEVMFKDEERRKEMGRAAQRWVATEFSQDRFWDELIRYYRAWLD